MSAWRGGLAPMSTAERNRTVGQFGERLAAQKLVDAGMVVLDRNWRCRAGEVDLVLRDGQTLVFCEVKTRSTSAFGHPLEAVQPRKAARLRRLAAAWLEEHDVRPVEVRIDLVGVLLSDKGAAEVVHVRGVG